MLSKCCLEISGEVSNLGDKKRGACLSNVWLPVGAQYIRTEWVSPRKMAVPSSGSDAPQLRNSVLDQHHSGATVFPGLNWIDQVKLGVVTSHILDSTLSI